MMAQSINVFNVNASNYPLITADYVAYDNLGVPLEGLTEADFKITETFQGGTPEDLSASIVHDCVKRTEEPEASIIIVLDRSGSMRDMVGQQSRFRYCQDAIQAFVNRIKFTGETRVCFTTFSGTFEIAAPWTNVKDDVTDTLMKMEPQTKTDYPLPFEGPPLSIYDLFAQRPESIPRYVFFLTDGHPNPDERNWVNFIDANLPKLRSQGVRFYSVTILASTTHITLEAFAKGTGGKAIVTQEGDLVDLFSYLALETQVREVCTLTWVSPPVCRENQRNRTAEIQLLVGNTKPTANVGYTTPPQSVGATSIDFPVLFCGDPPPNNSNQASVTITATGQPLNVTGFDIVPAGFFRVVDWGGGRLGTFSPFRLDPGQSVTLKVEFTQGAQQIFRQAQLQLQGNPCPPTIDLVGGQGFVILNNPKGGNLYSTCDTIVISWSGVLPTTPVRLEYSDDSGITWKLITDQAYNLSYKWLAPGPGSKYRIRVAVAPVPQYQWASQIGDAGRDSATSVAVAPNDLFVYTSGFFDGPGRFGDTYINNQAGNIDGYLCKWDANGTLLDFKHLRGDAQTDERVSGVITDKDGNIYVAGHYSSNSTFDGLPLPLGAGDNCNMFLYKFDKDMNVVWVARGQGGGGNTSNARCSGVGIRYDANGYPLILVRGTFQRFVRVGYNASAQPVESARYTDGNFRNYYAIFDGNGTPITFSLGIPPAAYSMSALKANDSKGYQYETGSFTGVRNFTPPPPGISMNSRGQSDVFLSKFGSTPASVDSSKSDFSVQAPELAFVQSTVVMDPTAQGQTSSKSFPAMLCNNGDFDVEILDVLFNGANGSDFSLIGNLRTVRLKPGECVAIELAFHPSGTGKRTGTMEVRGSCNTVAILNLEGEGLAPCLWDAKPIEYLGRIALGAGQRTFTIQNVICNRGPIALSGNISKTGSPDINITVGQGPFTLAPTQCHSIDITVTPNTPGTHSISLDYGLPSECGVPNTVISVDVVEPKVTISNVSFGRHRVGNVVVDTIFIENQSTEPAEITSLTPEYPADGTFGFSLPGTPFNLASGERKPIPVTFNPQARGPFSETLTAIATGQQAPLVGTATGTGFLPAIDATGVTFPAITVGQTAPNNLFVVIRNVDADSPLQVNSARLAGTIPDFTAIGTNWQNFPISIPIGDSVMLEVSFTPDAAGTREDDVVIEHDAKPGPGPIPPYTSTVVKVTGVGIEQSVLPPLDFGNVLTCASQSQTVTITNPNPSMPLVLDAPVSSGDIAEFTITPPTGFTLAPGESRSVTITFTPSATLTFSAQFSYTNNQALDIIINASGRGITTSASLSFGPAPTINVGSSFPLQVNVDVGDMQGIPVTAASVVITYPKDYIAFNSIESQQPGWVFVPDNTTPGTLVLNGTPTAPATMVDGMLITLRFDAFLTANLAHHFEVNTSITPDCVVPTGDEIDVDVEQFCYSEGRLISIGMNRFAMQEPQPNPSDGRSLIRYSTGITCPTTFELVNSVGTVVRTIVTPVLPSGEYELTLDTSDVGSGLYVLRMTSGHYSTSRLVSVVK